MKNFYRFWISVKLSFQWGITWPIISKKVIFQFDSFDPSDLTLQIKSCFRAKIKKVKFWDNESPDGSFWREFDADSESVKIFHFWAPGGAPEPKNWFWSKLWWLITRDSYILQNYDSYILNQNSILFRMSHRMTHLDHLRKNRFSSRLRIFEICVGGSNGVMWPLKIKRVTHWF